MSRPLLRAGALVVLAATAPWACSDGTPSTLGPGPYAGDIKAAATEVSTDFERDVLRDGVITRAEYEEAVQRLVPCGQEHGVTIGTHDAYGLYTYSIAGGDPDDVMGTCSEATTMTIESLYSATVTNPEREDFNTLVVDCYGRTGLVTPDFDRADLEAINAAIAERGGDTTGVYPFDPDDERFLQCDANPSYE